MGKKARLDESTVVQNPIAQFEQWYQEAQEAGVPEPEAMALATASRNKMPSVRYMLFKGISSREFIFYTNYESRKGEELRKNPHVAIAFYWFKKDGDVIVMKRQVRIEGAAICFTPEESDAYFRTRPRGSQLAAWASPQSRVISSRKKIEMRALEAHQSWRGQRVERPPFWGGYRVYPCIIEFWEGREDRLHDRIRYRLDESKRWVTERLAS